MIDNIPCKTQKYYYVNSTDYGTNNYHNLGDFVYSLCLDNFLRLHGVEYSTVRKDKIGQFEFNTNDMLIMNGFFPGINKNIKPNKSCTNVKFIGFHYQGKQNPGIQSNDYVGNFGCRDFGTYRMFQNGNPKCYVSLCASLMANLLDFAGMKMKMDRTIFVDCPEDFMRNHKDKSSVIMTHWIRHEGRNNQEMCKVAYDRLKYYKEHAKIMYTTKLHVYLPCVAMGIPVKYIGPIDYRTEIVNIVTPKTIGCIQPLLIQNFEHEIFGIGEDVHQELHDMVMNMKIEKNQTNQTKKRNVSILMASFPYRKKWMLQCMERLMSQCDNFYLWLNEYKEIPEELKKFDQNKLHVTLAEKNLKENGRYTFLTKPELQNDYCFICDDDIRYPQDYVQNVIECFKRNGDDVVVAHFVHTTVDFEAGHLNDETKSVHVNWVVPHNRFGLGATAFVPDKMKFKFTYDELVANYDMEMFFAQQCHEMGIKVVSPRRPSKFVTFLINSDPSIDKYALHFQGNEARTRMTYEYMKSRGILCSNVNRDVKDQVDFRRFQFG